MMILVLESSKVDESVERDGRVQQQQSSLQCKAGQVAGGQTKRRDESEMSGE